MRYLFKPSCLIVIGLLLGSVPLPAAIQATFYLSPSGDDTNDGTTMAHAFATLTRARDAVRQINSAMTGDIVVRIAKGNYPVSDTITFTDHDSGTNGYHVIYQSQDGLGVARFMGGTQATGWTPYKDNIYQANVGPGLGFTTLYENGIRADLARWPKRTSPFATSRGGYMSFLPVPMERLLIPAARI
jgi:hypothetical protein